MAKLILILGTLLGLTSVGAGAAEHAVRGMIEHQVADDAVVEAGQLSDPPTQPQVIKRLDQYRTAVRYHMTHGLALIGLGLMSAFSARGAAIAGLSALCFVLGVCLFSGMLYLISAWGVTSFTMLVPVGGMLMIAGWVLFLTAACLFDPLIDREDLES